MELVVEDGRGAHPTWRLYSETELVAWAGKTFATKSAADRAARAFRAGAHLARYEVYQRNGQWRWRARRSSSIVAYSGQRFGSRHDAERAAEMVRHSAEATTSR
jgi:uncharacterized protein